MNILTKLSVTQTQLNMAMPSERSLYNFSKAADHSQLPDFGIKLGLTPNRRYCAFVQSYNHPSTECLILLVKWRHSSKNATLYRLLEIFDMCQRSGHNIDLEEIQNGIIKLNVLNKFFRKQMETKELKQDFENKKIELYLRGRIEEKSYKKIAENMLCLSYAYVVTSEIADLFICAGCEEEQANQQDHDCMMLTPDEIISLYFEEAIGNVYVNDIEKTWQQFVMQYCIAPHILQKIFQDEDLRKRRVVKCKEKIKRYTEKIEYARMNLFVSILQMDEVETAQYITKMNNC